MLAVVKEHLGPGFSVKEVPYPVLRDTDVIIKVRSVGICGSDGPILAGTRPVPYPLTPGHEFSGDVVEVGKAVKNLKVGDRVTPCIVIGCGDCDMCIEGKEVLCDELVETGIHVDGAMAEYVRVPAKVCRKMRDTTTYDQGASVDPIASAYRTVKASGITSKDVCCVYGAGPIGLYAVRAGVQTTVLTKGSGALARAETIENYYGFAQPVSGPELERRSIENARRLGVQFVQTEAVGLTWTDRLTVETLAGAYPADAVILATGASRAVPRIPGLTGLEGHGVSWCAACDAFFYRGKDVAVLGSGEYALHEVQALLPVVKSVTLLTNGAALTADFPPEVTVCTQKVEAILGEQTVTGVQLAGGAVREVSGVFVALGVAGSTALARKLGAAVEGSRIVVDDKMQTTVPGLYAAGDCTGGLLQVAKAVYEGALAGTEAAKALRKG